MLTEYSTNLNDIGSGYRNVTTARVDGKPSIVLFGYSKLNGDPKTFVIPWKTSVLYNVNYKTETKDIFGKYIEKKTFDTPMARNNWLKARGNVNVLQAFRMEEDFLHDKFSKCFLDSSFNTQKMRIHYLDIENEVSDTFVEPKDATNRINLITIYDSVLEQYISWSLVNVMDTITDKSCVIYGFSDNEEEMLKHFCKWFSKNHPDVITGWNTYFYDMPYLVKRIEIVLGKAFANKLSPVGRYRFREGVDKGIAGGGKKRVCVAIDGMSQLDLLILYRDKFKVRQNLDGGYGLSNVGEAEGLGRKLEYDGSIKDFYLRDFQRFYEYNVRDVELTVKIEEKCKLIPLARKISSFGLSLYESIYSSIGYITGSLSAYANLMLGTVFPTYLNEKKEKVVYEGAFVFPTVSGFYKDGIGTVDFNSLYPNTMISINLSPETYVGKLVDEYDKDSEEYTIETRAGKFETLSKEKMDKLLETKCIITKNNTLFLKHEIKWGVISSWCKYFYNTRKSIKKTMKLLEHKLSEEGQNKEIQDEIFNLDNSQYATKILLNSCYGLFGSVYCPFYNPDLAQTITRQGRFANTNAAKYIFDKFKKIYSVPDDYVTVISGDTDSLFMNLSGATESFCKRTGAPNDMRTWTDSQKKEYWKEINSFVEGELNPFVQGLIEKECHTSEAKNLKYELEYIADSGIYEAKKRYMCHKILEGGETESKFKYTGIELKRAVVPARVKRFLGEIYENTILERWDESTYHSYLNKAFEEFKTFPIDDVAFWKGYNTEKKSLGFLVSEKGSGSHVRALNYYNSIIKKMRLGKKYQEILVGDKLRYVHILKSNPFCIDVIAYKDVYPKEFEKLFSIDYETMFTKLFMQPLAGYEKALGFKSTDPSNQPVEDVLSL